jgi:hypothetical protein
MKDEKVVATLTQKSFGIALILLGVSGGVVALLHLLNINPIIVRYTTIFLSLVVMGYGIWLLQKLLQLNSRRKYAHAKKHGNKTDD